MLAFSDDGTKICPACERKTQIKRNQGAPQNVAIRKNIYSPSPVYVKAKTTLEFGYS